ncbi:hypothetical protein CYMTET_48723 [Cymbomonas tetramitiformis]|uniref:EF-hand domain-containing protein n=1 Tax=Cymbomonas tetramitiformis TaxID=36881 RepID=A0AAE0BRN0_9CHLO|nr:hypothetical protein CYMTET_48723 [Cymbomonas tetramitiformis]
MLILVDRRALSRISGILNACQSSGQNCGRIRPPCTESKNETEMGSEERRVILAHAQQFCLEHGLDSKIVGPLTTHIQQNLEKVLKEAASSTSTASRQQPRQEKRRPTQKEAALERLTRPTKNTMIRASHQTDVQQPLHPGHTHTSNPSSPGAHGGTEVFSRLYQQAMKKKKKHEEIREQREKDKVVEAEQTKVPMSYLSKELMKGRTKGEYANYGERLYVEGVLQRKQLELKQKARVDEEKEAEVREITSAPQISEVAKRMHRPGGNAWERLQQDTSALEMKDKKLVTLKKLNEEQEMEACSFKPNINRRSDKLMKDRTEALRGHNLSAHDQLFQDAERRKIRQEEYMNWMSDDHTFQPNAYSRHTTGSNVGGSGTLVDHSHVVERLTSADKRRELRLSQLRESLETDASTGQKLFKPVTGRAPQFGRNNSALPIGEFLYSIRHEFDDKKEYIAERERQSIDTEANRVYAGSRSRAIVVRMKQRMFKKLFKTLDDDGDGRIFLEEALEKSNLSLELVHDLEECLQLRGPDPIDLNEFQALMEHVLGGIKTGPRNYLVPEVRKDDHDNFTFKPRVNRYSKMLASRRRGKHQPVYEALLQDKAAADRRLEELKEMQTEQDLQECTFRPKLETEKYRKSLTGGELSESRDMHSRSTEERFLKLEQELQDVLGIGDDAEPWHGGGDQASALDQQAMEHAFQRMEQQIKAGKLDLKNDKLELADLLGSSDEEDDEALAALAHRQIPVEDDLSEEDM